MIELVVPKVQEIDSSNFELQNLADVFNINMLKSNYCLKLFLSLIKLFIIRGKIYSPCISNSMHFLRLNLY